MENNNESWEENIYEFYKVKNKFTQSSDLIHRVVTKIGRDVVTPLQNNYDKLKEDNALLLNALKVCGKMLDEKKRKVNARLTSYELEIYSTVLKAIKQVESK